MDSSNPDGDARALSDDWVEGYPWSVFFPGLPEERAKKILGLVEKHDLSRGGALVDPRESLSIHIDRVTAEWLRLALSEESAPVHSLSFDSDDLEIVTPTRAREEMRGFVEDLDEFLA
jgi:hypothetical protein